MADIAKIARNTRQLRESLGLNQTEFASRLDADQSSVSKWERARVMPDADALVRLASLAKQTVEEFTGIRPPLVPIGNFPGVRIKVVGAVAAGAWREAIEWPEDDQYEVNHPFPKVWARRGVRGFVVDGPSMNRRYPEGSIVYVAPTISNSIRVKSGDRVMVSRRSHDGLYEATLKQLRTDENGVQWLWPDSTHPDHQLPINMTDRKGDGIAEVQIIGKVVGSTLLED